MIDLFKNPRLTAQSPSLECSSQILGSSSSGVPPPLSEGRRPFVGWGASPIPSCPSGGPSSELQRADALTDSFSSVSDRPSLDVSHCCRDSFWMLQAKVVGDVGVTRGSYHSSPSGAAVLIASMCPRVLQVRGDSSRAVRSSWV